MGRWVKQQENESVYANAKANATEATQE